MKGLLPRNLGYMKAFAESWPDESILCFAVFDLKGGAFKPEYTGKMNFYLILTSVEHLRHPDDKPRIGLILCKEIDGIVAEYGLRDMARPLGVAEFTHLQKLLEEFKGTLPTIMQIKAELRRTPLKSDRAISQVVVPCSNGGFAPGLSLKLAPTRAISSL